MITSAMLSVVPIDPTLRRRLAAAAKRVTTSTEDRNRLIGEASAAGAPLREIAAVTGLSHVGVAKILKRNE